MPIVRSESNRRVTAYLSAALFVVSASARAEAPSVLEDVVAVVADQAILKSEVEERYQLLAPQYQVEESDTASSHQLRREILNQLVDDSVIVLEAKSQSIDVSDEEVNQQVQDAIDSDTERMGGADGFREQLVKQGLTEEALRSQYRDNARKGLLAQRLIERTVKPKVVVSDADVKRFYDENREKLGVKPRRLHIADLFVKVKADSVIEERGRARALEARAAIEAGTPFDEAARRFSDAPDAQQGGVLGRFGPEDLDGEFERVALGLEKGQIGGPVRSMFGWHVLRCLDRDPAGQWVELAHVLAEVNPTRADENRATERAAEIRREILSGKTSFEAAVRSYSDDEESRAKDGDLGWIPITGFAGAVKAVVDTLRVGRVATPVGADGGVHVFRLLGEEAEAPYVFEEIQGDLRAMASQEAFQTKLREYLDELRKKYFVEIRARY